MVLIVLFAVVKRRMLELTGPAGPLEARYDPAAGDGRVAVLCHPHPLYGGNMHDAVLDLVAETLAARGFDCLRFNFRGVGASAGTFDHGTGETFDLLAVVRWVQVHKGARSVWLAGYSFGSNVVWQALDALAGIERVWLVAPPIGRMNYPARRGFVGPVDVFLGTDDDFADHDAVDDWARTAAPAVAVHRIAGADHFFSGTSDALRQALSGAADTSSSTIP